MLFFILCAQISKECLHKSVHDRNQHLQCMLQGVPVQGYTQLDLGGLLYVLKSALLLLAIAYLLLHLLMYCQLRPTQRDLKTW